MYAEGSVEQILSGYEVLRVVRAHLMVDIALNTIITSHMLNVPIPVISPKPMDPTVMKVTSPDTERPQVNIHVFY